MCQRLINSTLTHNSVLTDILAGHAAHVLLYHKRLKNQTGDGLENGTQTVQATQTWNVSTTFSTVHRISSVKLTHLTSDVDSLMSTYLTFFSVVHGVAQQPPLIAQQPPQFAQHQSMSPVQQHQFNQCVSTCVHN